MCCAKQYFLQHSLWFWPWYPPCTHKSFILITFNTFFIRVINFHSQQCLYNFPTSWSTFLLEVNITMGVWGWLLFNSFVFLVHLQKQRSWFLKQFDRNFEFFLTFCHVKLDLHKNICKSTYFANINLSPIHYIFQFPEEENPLALWLANLKHNDIVTQKIDLHLMSFYGSKKYEG